MNGKEVPAIGNIEATKEPTEGLRHFIYLFTPRQIAISSLVQGFAWFVQLYFQFLSLRTPRSCIILSWKQGVKEMASYGFWYLEGHRFACQPEQSNVLNFHSKASNYTILLLKHFYKNTSVKICHMFRKIKNKLKTS